MTEPNPGQGYGDPAGSTPEISGQIVNVPEKGIPNKVVTGAKCIAVVPGLLKAGFIVAARHGRGVSTCRLPNGD
jgi:lipid-binding SYLF domain-containing protein